VAVSRGLYSIWYQFSLILFNLVPIFVNFVQFNPNFVSLSKMTKFIFYINVILKILFLFLLKFILNISFIIFIPNLTIILEGNYYICLIFGTCKK